MRIALVSALYTSVPPATYGSIELLVSLLAEELTHRGHEVTLFASGDSRTSGKLRAVCDRNLIDTMAAGAVYEYEYYANSGFAEAARERGAFDVIHSHLGLAKIPLSVLTDTPVVHTMHTAVGPDDQWVLGRYPDVPIVAVSKNQVATVPLERHRHIHVVHNGCDFDAYETATAPGQYLAFLGRMSAQKNPVDAIRLAQALDLPIVLAGKAQTRDEEIYFENEVRPLIDGSQVRHVGLVNAEQKRELLKNASAFLFPTNWPEPFAVAPLEALASGLPVLAYNNGSVAEQIDPGVTGFYGSTVEELVALAPAALALDRTAIREHARTRFSHHRMVDEYVKVYESVSRGH